MNQNDLQTCLEAIEARYGQSGWRWTPLLAKSYTDALLPFEQVDVEAFSAWALYECRDKPPTGADCRQWLSSRSARVSTRPVVPASPASPSVTRGILAQSFRECCEREGREVPPEMERLFTRWDAGQAQENAAMEMIETAFRSAGGESK